MIAVQQLVAVATGHARDIFDDEAAVAELRQLADGDHQTLERALTGVHCAAGQPLAEPGDRSGAPCSFRSWTATLSSPVRACCEAPPTPWCDRLPPR
jgi:hypothetical protein